MGKGKTGPTPQFPYTYEQTLEKFEDYKKKTASNEVLYPNFQNFLVVNDILIEEAENVIANPCDKNKELSRLLKKIAEWCFDQLSTNPNWHKAKTNGIYLSKQPICGYGYTDKTEVKQDTKTEINVKFGAKSRDPFG